MRTHALSYVDAVRLLGGDEPAVGRLGRLAGVAAGAMTVASVGTVDFFALRSEAVKWGNAMLGRWRERATGLSRFDRTERLVAAHSVIVVTAFYEALDAVLVMRRRVGLERAEFTAEEQVALATASPVATAYADMVGSLVRTPPPMPVPHRPFEATLMDLKAHYQITATAVCRFLDGLAAFENAGLAHAADALEQDIPAIAVQRYVASYRALAVDAAEFRVWSEMTDAQATRAAVRESVEALRAQLSAVQSASTAAVDAVRDGLGRRYRARLDKSILTSADAPGHLVLPTLQQGYVEPRGQVAVAGPTDLPATGAWWRKRSDVPDVQGLLLAHLTTPAATDGPAVVLGQPGSGKSVLTRVLAARLPAAEFLPVRVELRNVRADAPIQTQIEEALFLMLGETVSWPDLVRRAGPALPVVIMDGFDELLQATGLNRADYLENLAEFQHREAELGRPAAVLLTSRTVVADRARFPRGTVVVRLAEFDGDQVAAWLSVWNSLNEAGLRARDLRPLPVEAVLAHPELATQPLLLLLLALYDAGANQLQEAGGGIGRVELYERLFADFIEREVDKHGADRGAEQRQLDIEAEWRRLSAVALAMLNRGGDVINAAELDRDIPYLLSPEDLRSRRPDSPNRPLTVGELLVGRFFFIHESQARRDTGAAERSFEFLHATFGEFLAARQVVVALTELAEERARQRRRPGAVLDAGFLYAITSFVTVARRAPLWEFCRGLVARLDPATRGRCRRLVLELLPDAGYPHPTWSLAGYEPRRRAVAARHAAFSANLVCFAVLLADSPVDAAELVGEPVAGNWRRQARLWQSQLDPEDGRRLWQMLRVGWDLDAEPARLEIRAEDGADVGVFTSLPWPPDGGRVEEGDRPDLAVPSYGNTGLLLRRAAFAQSANDVRELLYVLIPFWRQFGDVDFPDSGNKWDSDAGNLLELVFGRAGSSDDRLRLDRYLSALADQRPDYRRVVLCQLVEDAAALHPVYLRTVLNHIDPDDIARDLEIFRRLLAEVALRETFLQDLVDVVDLAMRVGRASEQATTPLRQIFTRAGLRAPLF